MVLAGGLRQQFLTMFFRQGALYFLRPENRADADTLKNPPIRTEAGVLVVQEMIGHE